MKKSVLAIGGTSSDGCAGVLMDARVIASFGLNPACAVTAITAQNTKGVRSVFIPPAKVVREQLDAIFSDLDIAAVKIGMLGSETVAGAVLDELRARSAKNVVLDPVMNAQSDGSSLYEGEMGTLKALASVSTMITPNAGEAKALVKVEVGDVGSAKSACAALLKTGARAVLLKSVPMDRGRIADAYAERRTFRLFEKQMVRTTTHGGGCALASAIAANLALGRKPAEAAVAAERLMARLVAKTERVGNGVRCVSP